MEFTTLVNLLKLGWCLIVSVEFRDTSLNKELLPGLELTSQLVEVLTRFRTEKVKFMVDIEAMFHQVHISEKERSFLRYL